MMCGYIGDTSLVGSAPVLSGVGESIAKAKLALPFVSVSFDDPEGQETESYALWRDSYSWWYDEANYCAHGSV